MTTPPQPPGAPSAGPPSDDRTRDLRRPSLPAAETVRLEQPSPEALTRLPDPTAGQPTDRLSSPPQERQRTLSFGGPGDDRPGPAASGSPLPVPAALSPGAPPAAPAPSDPRPGTGAPSYGSPAHDVGGTPAHGRRWPWAVLVLLPILVIAVTGVLLFLLLGGA